MEEEQHAVKDTFLSYYMFKPIYFIIKLFKENKDNQEELFDHMYNVGEQ